MSIFVTRDSSGLIQLWKYRPQEIRTGTDVIYGDNEHNFIGIEANELINDTINYMVGCWEVELNIKGVQ